MDLLDPKMIEDGGSNSNPACLMNFKLINERINNISKQLDDIETISKEVMEFSIQLDNINKDNGNRDELIKKQSEILQKLVNRIESVQLHTNDVIEKINAQKDFSIEFYHFQEKIKEHDVLLKELQNDSRITNGTIIKQIISIVVATIVGAILALIMSSK